jgi:MFS family permease
MNQQNLLLPVKSPALLQKIRSELQTKAPQGEFWLYYTASLFFTFGFSVFFFLFNLYLLGFGFTERSLGIVGSCMAVGSILGTIPVGMLAQRFGLRSVLTGGLLLAVVFSVLRACIFWPAAQYVLAVFTGLTLCTWAVCLSPAIAALTTEQRRPFAFSLMFASGIGTAGLGGFVAGRFPSSLQALPLPARLTATQASGITLLLACGVVSLALIPVARLTLRFAVPHARLPRFNHPFLLRFLPAMFVWSLVTGAFPPFANVYFVHHLGLPLRTMGSVYSLSQFAQFLAILLAPMLFRRAGLAFGVMLTQCATAAALVCLARIHGVTQAAWIYCGYMAVQCMNEPGIYSLLMERTPSEEHNAASASTFFISSIAQAFASAAVGAAIVRFGYSPVLAVLASLALLAALMFLRLARETRRVRSSSQS